MPIPVPRRTVPARFGDLFDWMDSPLSAMFPFGQGQSFRIEDYTDDGKYLVRAELPGLDPETDLDVRVEDGMLTIRADRREESREERRSEFRYGSLTRSVALPPGADPDHVTARYDNGILEVEVPVPTQAKPASRQITVESGSSGSSGFSG